MWSLVSKKKKITVRINGDQGASSPRRQRSPGKAKQGLLHCGCVGKPHGVSVTRTQGGPHYLECHPLPHWFSKPKAQQNHPEGLSKLRLPGPIPRVSDPQIGRTAHSSEFLTSFQGPPDAAGPSTTLREPLLDEKIFVWVAEKDKVVLHQEIVNIGVLKKILYFCKVIYMWRGEGWFFQK